MAEPARHHHPRRRVRQSVRMFRVVVVVAVAARRDDAEIDARRVDVDDGNLVRLLRLGLDRDELAVRRAPEPHGEKLIAFVMHEHVQRLGRAQDVTPHLVAAVRGVLRAVVHGHSFLLAAVLGVEARRREDAAPRHRAGGVSQDVRQRRAGRQVHEPRLVRLVAARINAVREQSVARRGLERADRAVLQGLRDFVHVQHDFGFDFGIVFSRGSALAQDDGVRASLDRAHEVLVVQSPRERRVVVGLLDGVFYLGVQLLDQRLDVLEVFFRVRVLRLQVRQHLGVRPRVVPEPEQVVVALDGGGHGVRPAVLAGNSPEKNLARLLLRLRGTISSRTRVVASGRRRSERASKKRDV